jgi:hypothetical protein
MAHNYFRLQLLYMERSTARSSNFIHLRHDLLRLIIGYKKEVAGMITVSYSFTLSAFTVLGSSFFGLLMHALQVFTVLN